MTLPPKITYPGIDQYNQVKGLDQESVKNSSVNSTTQTPFSNYLKDVVATSKNADSMAIKAVTGQTSELDVVKAMTDADRKIAEFQQIWSKTMQSIQDLNRQGT
ncbi:MAG: hypothetical protein K2X53_04455 [Alphaproteobacteria bacterium]|nr:hypothetical protein [Alphaproteobacteria bacterium]